MAFSGPYINNEKLVEIICHFDKLSFTNMTLDLSRSHVFSRNIFKTMKDARLVFSTDVYEIKLVFLFYVMTFDLRSL